jgi:magnesium transporter
MLPLFVITGVFGMNVLFPGEGTTAGFWVIVGLMVVGTVLSLIVFRWKRWL